MLAPLRILRDVLLDWWYGWFNLAVLSTIWVLACLTIVFAPPATFALFYVAHDLARGQKVTVSDLLDGIRRFFLKSWGWALMNGIVAFIFGMSFQFYGSNRERLSSVFFIVALILAGLWILIQIFTLAFFMMYEQPRLRTSLKSAAFTLFASPIYSVVLALFIGLLIVASPFLPILPFLGTPMLIALTASRAIRERLRTFKLIGDDDAATSE